MEVSHALVTPWPPQRNGIADYAHALAEASDDALLVVTQAPRPRPVRAPHAMTDPDGFLALPPSRRPAPLYHVGNNPDHAFLVPLFLRRPGVVVLHDPSLHYLAVTVEPLLPGFRAAQLAAEGPEIAALLPRVAAAGLAREMDHREVRLLAWLRAAPAVIVHSEAARRRVAPALPDVALHVVPHFCFLTGAGQHTITQWRDAARDPARDRWMADMAFSGPAFVLVSLGFPTADKQLERVIAAIARLPPPARSVVALLVAGEPRPGDPDLMAVAARHGCADRVRVLGWLAEAEAERLLLVADLVLALRFPTRGESSGAVARALGLGCAVLVSDHGAHAELPDAAVIKLPPRRDPTEPVRALLAGLIADRSRIARTRAAAFAHANTVGDAAAAAARHARIARGEAA